jgi:hypothetical protein
MCEFITKRIHGIIIDAISAKFPSGPVSGFAKKKEPLSFDIRIIIERNIGTIE